MGLGNRRSVTPCFCNEGCPNDTYPFGQYFITCKAVIGPDYANSAPLYRWTNKTFSGTCEWRPVSPTIGFTQEIFEHFEVGAAPGFKAYRFELRLTAGGITNRWWKDFITPLPESYPPLLNASNSCQQIQFLLPLGGGVDVPNATIFAAYPNACDDDDFLTHIQKKLWPERT